MQMFALSMFGDAPVAVGKPESKPDCPTEAPGQGGSMIFTARFPNKNLASGNIIPVRISVGYPRYKLKYELREVIRELAPTRAMLSMSHDLYVTRYKAIVDSVGAETVGQMCAAISERYGGLPVALLCFEDIRKPGEWCHRRMFASWYENETGIVVPELTEG